MAQPLLRESNSAVPPKILTRARAFAKCGSVRWRRRLVVSLIPLIVASPVAASRGHCAGHLTAGKQSSHSSHEHHHGVVHAVTMHDHKGDRGTVPHSHGPRGHSKPSCCKPVSCVATLESRGTVEAFQAERLIPHPRSVWHHLAPARVLDSRAFVGLPIRGHPASSPPFSDHRLFLAYASFLI